MKKILLTFIILSFLCVIGCSSEKNNQNNFNDNLKDGKWNAIKIQSGQTGKNVLITDKKDLNKVNQFLKKLKLKDHDIEDLKGYEYRLQLLDGKKTVMSITIIGDMIEVNDQYYESDYVIKTDLLKELMQK